jgi:ADP-ribose pyrophosphatase
MLRKKDRPTQRPENVRTVVQTEWFSIDAVPWGSSTTQPYYRLSCKDSVEILAVDENGKIILVRQFRPALGMTMLELPAGHVDDGETPQQAIRRELEEETGYICDSLTYLGPLMIAPNRVNNTLHLFCGRAARLSAATVKESGSVEVVLMAVEELKHLIDEGKFQEVAGIATLFLTERAGLL